MSTLKINERNYAEFTRVQAEAFGLQETIKQLDDLEVDKRLFYQRKRNALNVMEKTSVVMSTQSRKRDAPEGTQLVTAEPEVSTGDESGDANVASQTTISESQTQPTITYAELEKQVEICKLEYELAEARTIAAREQLRVLKTHLLSNYAYRHVMLYVFLELNDKCSKCSNCTARIIVSGGEGEPPDRVNCGGGDGGRCCKCISCQRKHPIVYWDQNGNEPFSNGDLASLFVTNCTQQPTGDPLAFYQQDINRFEVKVSAQVTQVVFHGTHPGERYVINDATGTVLMSRLENARTVYVFFNSNSHDCIVDRYSICKLNGRDIIGPVVPAPVEVKPEHPTQI